MRGFIAAIEIFWLTSHQALGRLVKVLVTNLLISLKPSRIAFVAVPTHPFRFGWKITFIVIEITNQARFDLGLPELRPFFRCSELEISWGPNP